MSMFLIPAEAARAGERRETSGGQIPDRFIELLNRPVYNYWARRDHHDWQTPFVSHAGPKVMLINGWSGSGGDAFPYYFRKTGLGPLIGTRTWGGLIGISGNPQLIDGGSVTAPTFGFWNTQGGCRISYVVYRMSYIVLRTLRTKWLQDETRNWKRRLR